MNYIRNSVKAVVNAYTGAVTLYQWGTGRPDAANLDEGVHRRHQAEQRHPGLPRPHMRYPADLFEVQRQILAKYHVLNPQAFYGGQNFWTVPDDPSGTERRT